MRDDPSGHVRVVVAEALARMGDAGAAGRLGDFLAEGADDVLQLHAINALTYVGKAAEAARPAIIAASQRKSGSSFAASETSRPYVEYVRRSAEYLLAELDGRYDPASSRTPPELCQRIKSHALEAIGSEGDFTGP
jgi:hypothetical protein